MNKLLIIILAIICFSMSCGSPQQPKELNKGGATNEVIKITINNKSVDCYSETLKWRITDSTWFDTLVFFRNFIENDSSMRVSCTLNDINPACESLIYDDKNIRWICKGFMRINRYFLMSYQRQYPEIILSLYLIDTKTSEALEFRRYQIINNEITGINTLPTITDGFVPYDEFK